MQDNKNGLSRGQVEKSRAEHGENRLREYKRKSFFGCFLSNLGDPIIKVLIGALLINVIFMFPNINWLESGGIFISVIIATLVSTISEYSSENTFEKLKAQGASQPALVKREGEVCEIEETELVVGDLYIVGAGESVSADGTLVSGTLTLDESALTGESAEAVKGVGDRILKGSLVLSGRAEAIITEVGESTFYGRVARELTKDTRPSPLKKRLGQLATSISRLGYGAALIIGLAYLFNFYVIDAGFDWDRTVALLSDGRLLASKLLHALTLAVSIVVVAVPEGLPMMITVVLSSNMKRMMRDNVLVRKLVGIETSGNINLLFTDKTGTLTKGRLRVKEIISGDGVGYGGLSALKKAPAYEKYVTLCAGFCNDAVLKGKIAVGSDATDRCLREYFGVACDGYRIKEKIPFDSEKKYSCVTVAGDGEEITLYKGAPEKILQASVSYLDKGGEERALGQRAREQLYKRLSQLGDDSFRVVALAYKSGRECGLNRLVFLGLVAIRDKVRREVPAAIKEVQGAGVGVVMITGDNSHTAEAIARECGIISPSHRRNLVITGAVLDKMSDSEVAEIMPTLAVVARALPSDKSRLVRVAQSLGYVVGMTGDGINDAPALKAADVGFGMGSGTEVAKEACDVVIGDNNFASIAKAILYGRTIFESIRKFIVFQLTMNFAAVGISLLGPFIGVDSPVTVTQMLWVNIIMDTLGALAFAREPHLKEYMRVPPKPPEEKIISREMVMQIASTSAFLLGLCVWFLKSHTLPLILSCGDDRYILSAFFAMFIFTGVFTCFTARTKRVNLLSGIGKNPGFLTIMALISIMQISFIYFGGEALRCVPLRFGDLWRVILISLSVVVFDFTGKLLKKLFYKGEKKCQKRNTIPRAG